MADALGSCFDGVRMNSSRGNQTVDYDQWQVNYANLDHLVQVGTAVVARGRGYARSNNL